VARTFTRASSHKILLGTGTGPTFGPATMAFIARKATDLSAAGTSGIVLSFGQADASDWYVWTRASTELATWNGTIDSPAPFGWSAADGWCLIAVTKATGSVAPRFHKYVYSTNTWTHQDSATAAANRTPTAHAMLGGREDPAGTYVDFFDGDVEIAGAYASVMTDTQIESLPFNLAAWFQAPPSLLDKLDQSATGQKVVDLSGNAFNESAITGTAVATSSVPVFNYGDGIWTPTLPGPAGPVTPSPALAGMFTPQLRQDAWF
jgi:hypothetical protein